MRLEQGISKKSVGTNFYVYVEKCNIFDFMSIEHARQIEIDYGVCIDIVNNNTHVSGRLVDLIEFKNGELQDMLLCDFLSNVFRKVDNPLLELMTCEAFYTMSINLDKQLGNGYFFYIEGLDEYGCSIPCNLEKFNNKFVCMDFDETKIKSFLVELHQYVGDDGDTFVDTISSLHDNLNATLEDYIEIAKKYIKENENAK